MYVYRIGEYRECDKFDTFLLIIWVVDHICIIFIW